MHCQRCSLHLPLTMLWLTYFITAVTLIYFAINFKFIAICFKIRTLSPWSFVKYVLKLKSPEGRAFRVECSMLRILSILDMTEVALESFQIYGDTFFSWMGCLKTIITRDPDFASAILTSPSCKEKSWAYQGIITYTDDGILTCCFQQWQKLRKVLCLAVNQKENVNYVSIINSNSNYLIENIEKVVGHGEVSLDILFKKTMIKNSAETYLAKDILKPDTIPVHDIDRFVYFFNNLKVSFV